MMKQEPWVTESIPTEEGTVVAVLQSREARRPSRGLSGRRRNG